MNSSPLSQPETSEKTAAPPKEYDVFINHRGPDVKETLALDLYSDLKQMGYRAFLDSEEIEMGDFVTSAIRDAISASSVQIAIFSRRYAESPWCLDELGLMLETKSKFIPVFYGVKPWELRYAKGCYLEAFQKYESTERCLKKLDDWKRALNRASLISGYELEKDSQYHSLCKKLVSAVAQEVESRRTLDVAKYPVGLDALVADFERRCGSQVVKGKNVKIVGISGMGGTGKTTLAKELFNRKRSKYNGSCFVADVRESSARGELASLQTKLIKYLFKESHLDFQNTSGTGYLRNRLKSRGDSCYLIILDDIGHQDQIHALLCMDANDIGSDSLVLITARDSRVLTRAGFTVHYNMGEMSTSNATELFCWHAFRRPNPDNGYEDLVQKFVQLCQGLPLSLEVLGGHVYGSHDKLYWQRELDTVKKLLPEDLKQRLKISFNTLGSEEKHIFLDIACFFIGKEKDIATRIWKASGCNAEHALQSLIEKSLVKEGYKGVLIMHDHLRDMGREIADELSLRRLWLPSYLKSLESKGFQNILTEINGRCFHSIYDQSIGCKITYFVTESNAGADRSTTLVWLELDLDNRQMDSIPSWIPLQSLQCLRIVNGSLKRLLEDDFQGPRSSWISVPILQCLMSITRKFQRCPSDAEVPFQLKQLLLETPVLEGFPDTLEKFIHLENLSTSDHSQRGMLIEGSSFSESLKKLSNLRRLVLRDVSLSGEFDLNNGIDAADYGSSIGRGMNCLQTIDISHVKLTSKISICGEICPRLELLELSSMANLAEVHLWNVTTVSYIGFRACHELKIVSGTSDLRGLKKLSMRGCASLEEVPNLSGLHSLEMITIDRCRKLQNINGIEDLKGLKYLYVSPCDGGIGVWDWCQRLKRLPSQSATVIGIAVDEAESILNANLFSGMVSPDAVTELYTTSENRRRDDAVEIPNTSSAIIICALISSYEAEQIATPTTSEVWLAEGNQIVTIVLTGQKGLYRHTSPNLEGLWHAWLRKKYVVTVNGEEEFKALDIFKTIIAQLYQGIP